jgi:SAM-dependent methyltransferase
LHVSGLEPGGHERTRIGRWLTLNELAAVQVRGLHPPTGERVPARGDEQHFIGNLGEHCYLGGQRIGTDQGKVDFTPCQHFEDTRAAARQQREIDLLFNKIISIIGASTSRLHMICQGRPMQQSHWTTTFARRPDMFGSEPSEPAREATALFERTGQKTVLELGGGQGRDSLFFASRDLVVTVLDYAPSAIDAIAAKAIAAGLEDRVTPLCHDVRTRLPFNDATFDCCYSHMLFCMALTEVELARLAADVWRVLKPGGLHVYTVRHTGDGHYRTGIHRGEDMYEVGGFTVHFFDRAKIGRLAAGYEILGIDECEEGGLPRKLFRVTLCKNPGSDTHSSGGGVR